jgi:hypothetical protein
VQQEPHRAAFPGQPVAFAFVLTPARAGSSEGIRWEGGGEPATGTGARFVTSFPRGGAYTVTATSGSESLLFPVTVCPLEDWLDDAALFFGPSLDLSKVTIKASRFVFGPPGTGWTCNTVVRFKRPRSADELPSQSTLVHELAHVWQHQSGQAQLLKGIVEQAGRILGRDPYDFGGHQGAKGASALAGLRKEAQAEIVRELWRSGHGFADDRRGGSFSTPGYREDLARLVDGAGIGRQPAGKRTIGGTIDSWLARLVNAVLTPLE